VIFFLSTFHTLTECAIKILLRAHMKANMIVYCSLNLGLSICFLHEHPLHFKRQSFATEYVLGGGVNNATPSSIQDLAKSFSNFYDEVLVCLPSI